MARHRRAQAPPAVQTAERLAAVKAWKDNDLVFCTSVGRPLDCGNVGRAICKEAGNEDHGKRVPYEMRHTHVSLLHDSDRKGQKVIDTIAAQAQAG